MHKSDKLERPSLACHDLKLLIRIVSVLSKWSTQVNMHSSADNYGCMQLQLLLQEEDTLNVCHICDASYMLSVATCACRMGPIMA